MAASSGGDDGEINGINVTPLVDIMLVLVIILFVGAEFKKHKLTYVKLPKIKAAIAKKEPEKISITVDKDNNIFWEKNKLDDPMTITTRLKSIKETKPDVSVVLRSDGETSYQNVVDVLDLIKNSGISKIGLAVEGK